MGFDVIGDVHGCYAELCALLRALGYAVDEARHTARPPAGRTAVFLGDLCNRGPDSAGVFRLVIDMAAAGAALCVAGNHEMALRRELRGTARRRLPCVIRTAGIISAEGDAFAAGVVAFLNELPEQLCLDGGRLVVCHNGFPSPGGGTGGRLPLSARHSLLLYGHAPACVVRQFGTSVCVDTGCVFGGALTAYRYPERQVVQQKSGRAYAAPGWRFAIGWGYSAVQGALWGAWGRWHLFRRARRSGRG